MAGQNGSEGGKSALLNYARGATIGKLAKKLVTSGISSQFDRPSDKVLNTQPL